MSELKTITVRDAVNFVENLVNISSKISKAVSEIYNLENNGIISKLVKIKRSGLSYLPDQVTLGIFWSTVYIEGIVNGKRYCTFAVDVKTELYGNVYYVTYWKIDRIHFSKVDYTSNYSRCYAHKLNLEEGVCVVYVAGVDEKEFYKIIDRVLLRKPFINAYDSKPLEKYFKGNFIFSYRDGDKND